MKMASSYDVFISFNGENVRNGFISHLHEALSRNKIEAFVPDREDKQDAPDLVRAIRGSKLSLLIFSEGFAFSKCCLEELLEILECWKTGRHSVVPIFYGVDPSVVRRQTRCFGDAFAEHAKMFPVNLLRKWKDALTEAANLSGWDSSVFRPDSFLVETIARDVLKKLNFISLREKAIASDYLFKKLIGIDSRVQKVMSLLNVGSQDFLMVGIWGMGGIGKTTLAEAVYHRISPDFQSSYFFRNVREAEEKGELLCLRDELYSRILGDDDLCIAAYGVGSDSVKFRLQRKRVLIVLDDVSGLSQLEALLGGQDVFGAGSRVIVTTRNKQVLNWLHIEQSIYFVEKLNEEEASQLFCQYAFSPDNLDGSYDELIGNVVNYAHGVPLALKVLGSSLRGKQRQLWENALRKLKKLPNLKILDVLKISYDSLDDEDTKDIFLDIACFFKGLGIGSAATILDSCYVSFLEGIGVLIDKVLITIRHNCLEMHDLLQELGWEIVRQESKIEPGKRSRLWKPEDVHHVLKRNSGTGAIRGMFADLSKTKAVNIRPDAFEKMYNLKFLWFCANPELSHKQYLPCGLRSFPDELRYLYWVRYPIKSLPFAFCPQNLVELHMNYSNLNQLWSGTQNLHNLKILSLASSKKLKEMPDLSQATNLENIHLADCESLVGIPSSIGNLHKLVELNLSDCKKLKSLPSNINLRSLVDLNLNGCSQIDEFPEISTNLEEITLSGTSIKEVPCSIQRLSRLVTLRLGDCLRLENLPDTFQSLDSLETLDLRGCRNIKRLPDLPGKIKFLYLEETGMQELLASTGSLSILANLSLRSCRSLKTLPNDIWKLESLDFLSLWDCSKVEEIPEILDSNECLEALYLSGTAIRELPSSIDKLVRLQSLCVDNCQNLSLLPETLWNLKDLNSFKAHGTAIRSLPPFRKDMKKLTYLCISGCDSRDPVPLSVPLLSRVRFLDTLRLKDLHIMHIPEDIGSLTSLTILDLSGNDFMILPAGIKHLLMLQRLDLSYCRRLESLPELPSGLKNLDAHDCASLQTMWGDMEFLMGTVRRTYIFSNCFRLQEDMCIKILAAAKFLLQPMPPESLIRRTVTVCLPGSNIPDWFTDWVKGPSMTLQLRSELCDQNFKGLALCISVAFMDYFTEFSFKILCEYRFEREEGDYLEKSTIFIPWEGLGIEGRLIISNGTWEPLKFQHRYLWSDHIFLCYDESTFSQFTEEDCNWVYETVTITFRILDETNEPLRCCSVEKCGYFMLPTQPVAAPNSLQSLA